MNLLEEELEDEGHELALDAEVDAAALRSPASLTAFRRGLSGIAIPLLTVVLSLLGGALIVLATGHDPLKVSKAIFNGSGINWLFPWVTGKQRATAAGNLQFTLLQATPLMLTGIAVAFAFRAGMFNIGGQGQYTMGAVVAIQVGSAFAGMPPVLHITLAILAAALAGAVWAGIAGVLKAYTGANEVISTIMLNWIAIWFAYYAYQIGGPLQDPTQQYTDISRTVANSAKLPVFWGSPVLEGLDIGIFIAVALAAVYWVLIKRTRVGFEARAVGFNPEAARYSGISVERNWIRVMLICGAFAGAAAALDMLGWKFYLYQSDILVSQIGFYGIAVALLGRNSPGGIVAAAIFLGALFTGTASRNFPAGIIDVQLVPQLTFIIEGLIIVLVSTDVLTLRLLKGARGIGLGLTGKLRPGGARPSGGTTAVRFSALVARPIGAAKATGRWFVRLAAGLLRGCRQLALFVVALPVWLAGVAKRGVLWLRRLPASVLEGGKRLGRTKLLGIAGVVLAALAWVITLPPIEVRSMIPSIVLAAAAVAAGAAAARGGQRKLGISGACVALAAIGGAYASQVSAPSTLEAVFVWSSLAALTLQFATPLVFAALGGVVSESSGVINVGLEGMMLMGAFWGVFGADQLHSWALGLAVAALAGGLTALLHAVFSIHLRANQIVTGMGINFLALGITSYWLEYHYGPNGTTSFPQIPNVHLPLIQHIGFFGAAFGDQNLMTWIGLALVPLLTFFLFRTRWGLRLRSVGEKPRAADTVGLPVLRIRYLAVISSGVLAALGGAYLSVGYTGSFIDNMTSGRGFIALAAMIFGKWKPWGALWACLLFGFGDALYIQLNGVNATLGALFNALPYLLTLIAVGGFVGRSRPPAADGIPYVRE